MMALNETPAPPGRVWPEPPGSFSTAAICALRHDIDRHPLMALPQLLALAREIEPAGGCRFLKPSSTDASPFEHDPSSPRGFSIDEVFRRIEEPGAWIALYNVEQVPRYRHFLEAVVESMRPFVEREQPEIFLVTGFVFISAPPSVTPFHIDRENNFWLQVRGQKTIGVWQRDATPPAAVEEFIVHRNLDGVRLTEALRARCQEHRTSAGQGLYFPSTTPHMTRTTTEWVAPGDGVSISIGINFYTSVTRRHAQVHHFNRLLRRLGIDPVAPGIAAWRDALKAPLGRAALRLLQARRKGFVVPPGTLES